MLSPDISYDGRKVLFAHCKFYPGLREEPNKLDKNNVPEDAFYHLYEMNLDGTGLRRLTRGKYDDFDGRYLPNGEIVFLSTRRGQFLQCGKPSGQAASDGALPDSYVRCGGGPERPVAVYTLHVMDSSGGNLRQISAFEMFEWTPSVDHDGRILYARWDYVDRCNMPFMKLWSTLPDGTGARAVFGNFTQNPHCVFEARAIPGSRKLIFTASGHHANTGGSLVLLDPSRGDRRRRADHAAHARGRVPRDRGLAEDATSPTRYPLSENHYLVAWSDQEMIGWPGPAGAGQRHGHLPVRRLRQPEPALPRPGDFQHDAAAGPAAAAAAGHPERRSRGTARRRAACSWRTCTRGWRRCRRARSSGSAWWAFRPRPIPR